MSNAQRDPDQGSRGTSSSDSQAASPLLKERSDDTRRRNGLFLFICHFCIALQFFTRIPITGRLADWVGFSPAMLRASAAHFPGVGWVVGGLTALVFCGLTQALPSQPASPWVAAVLCTAFSVWLTGAFHEDGLADTADGLGGAVSRERALDIMKDSLIGSYGAIALVLSLLTKVLLLGLLTQAGGAQQAAWALFGAHVTSRLMPLFIIRALPHVGDTAQSKSKPLAESIGTAGLLTGVLWWAAAMVSVGWMAPSLSWLSAVLGALTALAWMWRLLQRRLQGFTGDGLGATQQLSELLFYLGLALTL
jgi:adenosylcobinamide-GDP ribazoletransferase